MSARLPTLLLILLGLASSTATALEMPIYEGEVALAAGQDEHDDGAIRSALIQVLIKVSGDRSVAEDPGLAVALADIRQAVVTTFARNETDGTRVLVVDFDPGAIHDRLATLGRPVWSKDRPPLLVWLGIDDGRQKQIAGAKQVAALSVMTEQARSRGVPLLLPQMDEIDLNRLNPVTLWVAPPQTVIAASQRYAVQTALVIRLRRGTSWQAQYTLIDGRNVEEWSQSDTQSGPLLAAGIDGAADRLARRYAVEPIGTAIGGVDWWIEDLRSAQDYGAIVGYLSKLEFVRELRVLRAEGNRLLLHLDLAIGERRLRGLLALDGRLELLDPAAPIQNARLRLGH